MESLEDLQKTDDTQDNDSLREENERLKQQLELMSSQTRRVNSQIWTTNKVNKSCLLQGC